MKNKSKNQIPWQEISQDDFGNRYEISKSRLEAFTDGIVAIVITVLVLNIKIPDTPTLSSIYAIRHTFLAYLVSFTFVAIIWVSHHRLFQLIDTISYRVIWADIFWLFWLTICPAVTDWVGENPGALLPNLSYVIVYTMWSWSFGLIARQIIASSNPASRTVWILKQDHRSYISMVCNIAIFLGVFVYPPIGLIGRFFVSFIWIFSYQTYLNWQSDFLRYFHRFVNKTGRVVKKPTNTAKKQKKAKKIKHK